jgi:hypothetical protein
MPGLFLKMANTFFTMAGSIRQEGFTSARAVFLSTADEVTGLFFLTDAKSTLDKASSFIRKKLEINPLVLIDQKLQYLKTE